MSHFRVAWSPRLSVPCAAGTLSLLAHATVLAILMSSPAPKDWPSSIGRRVGSALIVRLKEHAEPISPLPATLPNVQTQSFATSQSSTDAEITPATEASPAAESPSQMGTTDAQSGPIDQLAQPHTVTPPASAPGASFANLFAPIISRPMGRGRWTAPPTQVQPAAPDLQRQQAAQARRDQLMQNIQWLQRQLELTPLTEGCLVQVSLQQSNGEVRCSDPGDQDRIRSSMSSLLLTGLQPNVPSEVCLQLRDHTIDWIDCQKTPPPN